VVAAKLIDILRDIHLPEGVVNYLPGVGADIGPALVAHGDVDLIAFTGSREVGLAINRQAAELSQGQTQVKKVIAEMGGKNAIIIDDDADLDEAVLGVVHSAFGYSGQKCSACSRVIVLADIYQQFCERLKGAVANLRIGPPFELANNMGPVIDAEAKDKILAYIEQAKTEYPVLVGDELRELSKSGHFVAPHIFVDVAPQSKIAQEEIFGPVLVVIKAKDFKEALDIANQTPYALTGGVYSRSPQHLQQARMEYSVGNLYLNRNITGALVYRQPFGGFKLSGIGSKAGGPDYLMQFLIPVNVTENTLRRGFAPTETAEKK
jgi:RHH-type proline utilization regulon transcriptional repressor/proline dehydrogenase/delta 1-pyrroline-5-carboxylate dehydrogenase